ncbi:MAG: rhodanese-like domain-containing protein [Gemmatimonadetes bacterium]|nr:rhodanese-like domain-containing protein [Gemmatimonadota bacterium]
MTQHAVGFLVLVDDAKSRVRELNVPQTLERQLANPDVVLVDVREDREWNMGFAEGAIHLGKGVIERDVEVAIPNKDAEIILYCGGGFRSALAGDVLQKMGYTNVVSMDGGWRAWTAAGAPVTLP